MFKKLFVISILTIGFAFASGNFANAETICQPIYGGGETCATTELSVDKQIRNPDTNLFADGLNKDIKTFVTGEVVEFQISVTNNSGVDLARVEVRDIFPDFVRFESGEGSFDQNTNTLTYVINDLRVNETDLRSVFGRINELTNITNGSVCGVNQAHATADNTQPGQDNVTFCIDKNVVTTKGGLKVQAPPPLTQTPATGPEMLALFGLIPAGIGGYLLRRKSRVK